MLERRRNFKALFNIDLTAWLSRNNEVHETFPEFVLSSAIQGTNIDAIDTNLPLLLEDDLIKFYKTIANDIKLFNDERGGRYYFITPHDYQAMKVFSTDDPEAVLSENFAC